MAHKPTNVEMAAQMSAAQDALQNAGAFEHAQQPLINALAALAEYFTVKSWEAGEVQEPRDGR